MKSKKRLWRNSELLLLQYTLASLDALTIFILRKLNPNITGTARKNVNSATELTVLVIGTVVAFLVSILVIKFLMGYIKKHDFQIFGWYRIVLGILVMLYFSFV